MPKDSPKERYSKSTNMCRYEKKFTATNFNSLPRIEILFCYKIFGTKSCMLITYIPNFKAKDQYKKIYTIYLHVAF